MVAVHVRGLVKRYGSTEVLRGVDLQVPAGAFAVLVGPSGCGKSTLLRCIAGLEEVSGGSIAFDERDVTRLEPRERDIAMVFQSYALYPHMSVRENLGFGLRLRKTPAAQIATRVAEVASMLGLEPLLDRRPRDLSGGQRQRVAMGRAIVRRPALFLFDEPLSNLDPALRTQVRVDIRKQHDSLGATSIYVTHDQVEAMTLADVLFVLDGGAVQQRGAPLEVYEHPVNRFVASFVGSPAMNFVDVNIQGDTASSKDGRLSVPGISEAAKGGVTLGIRPHDIQWADSAVASLQLEVDLVETLGPESILHGHVDEAPFLAVVEAGREVRRGDRVPLRIRRFHVFDDEGLALASGVPRG
jgi:ABC-type sugar transport system ATPase subunit